MLEKSPLCKKQTNKPIKIHFFYKSPLVKNASINVYIPAQFVNADTSPGQIYTLSAMKSVHSVHVLLYI